MNVVNLQQEVQEDLGENSKNSREFVGRVVFDGGEMEL